MVTFLERHGKNKSGSTPYISSKHKNVFLNFRLAFEQNILFGFRAISCRELFSALEVYLGEGPRACKHSSTNSKKNILKAFVISRSIVNKPVDYRKMYN